MIERVERYVFTLRPGQADLLHRWAAEEERSPEQLAYRLLMIGVSTAGAHLLGWEPPPVDLAASEHYQDKVLRALREALNLLDQPDQLEV